ncbi:MAG: peptidoglycan DD-metalloendopeptidase family protein [Bradymonadia bacterium]
MDPTAAAHLKAQTAQRPEQALARKAGGGDETLKAAAAQFEALMMHQMLKSMRQTVQLGEGQGGGNEPSFARKMYTELLDEEYAQIAGKQGGLGLAELIVSQLGGDSAPAMGAKLPAQRIGPNPMGPQVPASSVEVASAAKKTAGARPVQLGEDSPYVHRGQTMTMPATGRLSSHFGPRRLHGGPKRHHKGLDIAAPTGRPIGAALPGKVAFAGTLKGYGKVVYLDHGDGLTTRYAHASALEVKAGDEVAQGQTIAAVGSTGRSTGPHLHFEVRRNGKAEDPLPWLGLSRADRHVHVHDHAEERPLEGHSHEEEEAKAQSRAELTRLDKLAPLITP